jgi:hypothetical protein
MYSNFQNKAFIRTTILCYKYSTYWICHRELFPPASNRGPFECKANLITTKLEKLLLELLLCSKPNCTDIHRTNSKFQHNAFMKILCYKYSTSHMCQRPLFPK